MKTETSYKLAIRWNWLTKYYDLLIATFMREKVFRNALLEQFQNKQAKNLLDIGCGTGSLLILAGKKYPTTQLTGIDGDENIMKIAQAKCEKEGIKVDFRQAFSTNLPFAANNFEAVTCSIMLHHLKDEDKINTLKEAYRVLKVKGEMNIADWGKASNLFTSLAFYIVQLFDGFDTTQANRKGQIPEMMEKAGFQAVSEIAKIDTILGTVSLYQGIKR